MKNKSKNKAIEKNEFRYKIKTGRTPHAHHVYEQEGNSFKSIGVSTKAKIRGKDSIPMVKNPEPNNKEKAYFRPVSVKDHKNKYGNILPDWKLHEIDDANMEKYRERATKKTIKKK